jgi:hypothetical protein
MCRPPADTHLSAIRITIVLIAVAFKAINGRRRTWKSTEP